MSITNNQRTREALFRRLSRLARRSLFGTLSETYRTCGRPAAAATRATSTALTST